MASLLADDTTEPLFTVKKTVTNKNNFITKKTFKLQSGLKLDKYRNENKKLRSRLDAIALRYSQSQSNENKIKQMLITVSEIKRQIDFLDMESELNVYSQRLISNLKQAIYCWETKIYNLREEIQIFSKIYRSKISVSVELINKQDHDYESSYFNTSNRKRYPLSVCGVAINKNKNIYVATCEADSTTTAFTLKGELLSCGYNKYFDYIYRLNEKSRSISSHPWGIEIYNNYLYITEGSTLSKYTLAARHCKYNLVKQITSYGNDRRLKSPRGIHVNNNGFIFVCDYGDNCIPIFDTCLEYQRTLSHKQLVKPLEVKTHYEQVYVLARKVIHILSHEGSYLKKIAHGIKSNYFIIDNYNNIVLFTPREIVLLSLYDNNRIKCRLELSDYANGFNGYLVNNSNNNSLPTGTLVDMSNGWQELENYRMRDRKTAGDTNIYKYHRCCCDRYGYESDVESVLFN